MNLLKNIFYHILGLLVLTNINPKLAFIWSMVQLIWHNKHQKKNGVSKVKEYILTWYADWLNFILLSDIECVLK